MAAGRAEFSESQHTDTYPLLMAHASSSTSESDHVVNVRPANASEQDHSGGHYQSLSGVSGAHVESVAVPVGVLNGRLPGNPASRPDQAASAGTTSGNSSSRSNGASSAYGNARQRTSPLNSGPWISFELCITVSQIVASIVVLSISRDEKPSAPLKVWIAGYAAGCIATLPLLYWRYTHRYVRLRDQDSLPTSSTTPPPRPSSPSSNPSPYVSLSLPRAHDEESEGESRSRSMDHRGTEGSGSGFETAVERFKIALDCFFAVWFVVGNVWIFGGRSSANNAPNLYRLCIVFLTFSCIGYAMPFILCATICCCLPCIIALLGFREEDRQGRGASEEAISALPTYKFKAKGAGQDGKTKEDNDSDTEATGDGGIVGFGTDNERVVSAEDALCCICLGKYKHDVELRELPCTHHFHVECVDKWLKINASCPLCKKEVGASSETQEAASDTAEEREERDAQTPLGAEVEAGRNS